MATKAEIINKVNTDLASNSNIQAVSHRGVLHGNNESIIDNFYGIVTTDKNEISGSTNNVVTFADSDFQYRLSITKQGGLVHINGILFTPITSIIPSDTVFFNITNPQYLMDTSDNVLSISVTSLGLSTIGNIEPVRVILSDQQFKTLDPIPINQQIRFSITYNTAN
jgi:hypothetical protein